jgi:hypothetical protein
MEGMRGGLLTMALFVAFISLSFSHVGKLVRAAGHDRGKLVLSWALGVSLFVHVTNFIAISYFGQMTFLWYLSLAMINSMTPAPVPLGRQHAVARGPHRGVRSGVRFTPAVSPGMPCAGSNRLAGE